MRVGRNDPCPCGSGNKFKNCCVGKSSRMSRGIIALIVVVATIAAIGLIPSLLSGGKSTATNAIRPGPSSPRQAASQSGRVWSQEHGHWHDASGQAASAPAGQTVPPPQPALQQQPNVVTTGNTPQPPGPAPAGQVWSAEHGHWHAAPK